jgi:hypothetical protein
VKQQTIVTEMVFDDDRGQLKSLKRLTIWSYHERYAPPWIGPRRQLEWSNDPDNDHESEESSTDDDTSDDDEEEEEEDYDKLKPKHPIQADDNNEMKWLLPLSSLPKLELLEIYHLSLHNLIGLSTTLTSLSIRLMDDLCNTTIWPSVAPSLISIKSLSIVCAMKAHRFESFIIATPHLEYLEMWMCTDPDIGSLIDNNNSSISESSITRAGCIPTRSEGRGKQRISKLLWPKLNHLHITPKDSGICVAPLIQLLDGAPCLTRLEVKQLRSPDNDVEEILSVLRNPGGIQRLHLQYMYMPSSLLPTWVAKYHITNLQSLICPHLPFQYIGSLTCLPNLHTLTLHDSRSSDDKANNTKIKLDHDVWLSLSTCGWCHSLKQFTLPSFFGQMGSNLASEDHIMEWICMFPKWFPNLTHFDLSELKLDGFISLDEDAQLDDSSVTCPNGTRVLDTLLSGLHHLEHLYWENVPWSLSMYQRLAACTPTTLSTVTSICVVPKLSLKLVKCAASHRGDVNTILRPLRTFGVTVTS